MLIVPLQMFITPFSEKGNAELSTWSVSDATDALRVANSIWMAANVQFHLRQPCVADTPLDLPKGSRTHEEVVQQYDDARASGRALAHEFGHLLDLDHVIVDEQKPADVKKHLYNLMVEGLTTGTNLEPSQIKKIKAGKLSRKFGG
jgi:hypothetical protein